MCSCGCYPVFCSSIYQNMQVRDLLGAMVLAPKEDMHNSNVQNQEPLLEMRLTMKEQIHGEIVKEL
jgi:hypothetical protein